MISHSRLNADRKSSHFRLSQTLKISGKCKAMLILVFKNMVYFIKYIVRMLFSH